MARRLAIVLHTHMPYVEGFGTWPFGEEWLWEAAATVYVPLLDLLDRRRPPLTLSVTPVLADQLEADGTHERLLAFLNETRVQTHALDAEGCRSGGRHDLAAEIERAAGDYRRAAKRLQELGPGGLARGLMRHASWTSSATHAVLPLVATDAGLRLQLRAGIDSHRARGGDWAGGLWLPECAYAPWLGPRLEEAGVHAVCVELTDVLEEPCGVLAADAGPLLVGIDRRAIDLVWSPGGYPSKDAYRDSHRRTVHHHNPWANDGSVYDRDRAREQAAADARDFVERVAAGPGELSVCALDTELLGHHWYEGLDWLEAVLDAAPEVGLELVALDDVLASLDGGEVRRLPPDLPPTSWGEPRTLWTWSGPQVADIAFATREAELRVVAAAERGAADERAVRELLALQSSDWAFLVTRGTAGPYPRERFDGHLAALDAALAAPGESDPRLRSLAPWASPEVLLEP